MKWCDEGVILSVYPYEEESAVVRVLTRMRGGHSGFVSRKVQKQKSSLLQPGNLVHVEWFGRLREQLGRFRFELIRPYMSELFKDKYRLTTLQVTCNVTAYVCPDHEEQGEIFENFLSLLSTLANNNEDWPLTYIEWEIFLLEALGFGLSLSCCGVTGVTETLTYVSPRSGNAVSNAVGTPYKDKLLPLPGFLVGYPYRGPQDIVDGLRLTSFFLHRYVLSEEKNILRERARLFELFQRVAANA